MRAWIRALLFVAGVVLCLRQDVVGIALVGTAVLMGPDDYRPRYREEDD